MVVRSVEMWDLVKAHERDVEGMSRYRGHFVSFVAS
jgi:hypothetical protein